MWHHQVNKPFQLMSHTHWPLTVVLDSQLTRARLQQSIFQTPGLWGIRIQALPDLTWKEKYLRRSPLEQFITTQQTNLLCFWQWKRRNPRNIKRKQSWPFFLFVTVFYSIVTKTMGQGVRWAGCNPLPNDFEVKALFNMHLVVLKKTKSNLQNVFSINFINNFWEEKITSKTNRESIKLHIPIPPTQFIYNPPPF